MTPLGRIGIPLEPPLSTTRDGRKVYPLGHIEYRRPAYAELWAFFAGLLSGLALAFAFAMQVAGG